MHNFLLINIYQINSANGFQKKKSVQSNRQGLLNLNKRCLYLTGVTITTDITQDTFTVRIPLIKK